MDILERISTDGATSSDVLNDLVLLGDELRSESFREQMGESPSIILDHCSRLIDEGDQIGAEAVRVLVNFTADNDRNRHSVLDHDRLLSQIKESMSSRHSNTFKFRVAILLDQFVHNTEDQVKFMANLYAFGMADTLLESLSDDTDLLQVQLEVEAAIVGAQLGNIVDNSSWQENAVARSRMLLDILESNLEEDPSILVHTAKLLNYLTSFETDPGFSDSTIEKESLALFSKIPQCEEVTTIKRHLFAACGNISSMNGYKPLNRLETIALFMECPDPYAVGAAAVSLGNSITSVEEKEGFFREVAPNAFLDKFFSAAFNDLVQLQGLHVLCNLMNEEMATTILLEHYSALLRISKMVVDNALYYREILAVYIKFLTRLVRRYSGDLQPYQDLWFDIERCDSPLDIGILYALLAQKSFQNERFDSSPYSQKLMAYLMEVVASAPPMYYDEKVKALGIFLTKIGPDKLDYVLYGELLSHLSRQDFPAHSATANNLKFVAAKTLMVPTTDAEGGSDVADICRTILAGQAVSDGCERLSPAGEKYK